MQLSPKVFYYSMWRGKNRRWRVSSLHQQISDLQNQVNKQGGFPAGHYYSPIPAEDDMLEYMKSRDLSPKKLAGIELNEQDQFLLLNEYSHFYKNLRFPDEQKPDFRFYAVNDWYSYADAMFLYSFLRKHKPGRIIEVGSGFTSAVMLDSLDRLSSYDPEITFIEPYPDRLHSLLRKGDEERVRIVTKKIQEVPVELFTTLKAGDFLLVDSTHVVKCGSDVQRLMFDILPLLPAGIYVHFHDIYYPFDYPDDWLRRGMYWNESYILRAFLSYNSEWDIYFFSNYVASSFGDFIHDKMPLCARNPGSSLYIRRKEKG